MEKRRIGNNITLENRSLANEQIDKKQRKKQIIKVLKDNMKDMTAREIAYKLYEENLVPFFERNMVAPRITELCQEGILEPTYSDIDQWTGKSVTVYGFTEEIKKNNYETIYG